MAQNSLFAILLRSRWWISMACGLVIVLLCMAVLPADIRVVGAMGSLPFFVVGAIAARRQWGQPGSARTQAILARAGSAAPESTAQDWAMASIWHSGLFLAPSQVPSSKVARRYQAPSQACCSRAAPTRSA